MQIGEQESHKLSGNFNLAKPDYFLINGTSQGGRSMAVHLFELSSSWQRGSNENTNGLPCQYFPKGKGMSIYNLSLLDEVNTKLITRPRKTLGFRTPAQVFEEALH